MEVEKDGPSVSRFELTYHRVAQPGELRETVSRYRACLMLNGPVSLAWKSGGREDRRELLAGDLCTESPGCFRSISWNAPLEFLRLEISPSMMAELIGENASNKDVTLIAHRGLRDANFSTLMQMLYAAAKPVETSGGDRLFCEQLGRTLAAYLYEHYCGRPANGRAATCLPGKILKTVLAYIDERITESIGVEDLARHAGISHFYFSRLFRNTVGRSPAQYILDRRMERAKELLGNMNLSFAEVARRTGFPNERSFASAFRTRNGNTPSRYRRTLP